MSKVVIMGAGQLGSRHLQALKAIGAPLDIEVIDPSQESLRTARGRYEAASGAGEHRIAYRDRCEPGAKVDVAIVATNSNVRRDAVERLLDAREVRFLVLEKLLFGKPEDAPALRARLGGAGVAAWVNCPMRMMEPYERIRMRRAAGPLQYRVTGSRYGLVTNAIHYLDHVLHLTGCERFELDLSGLDAQPVASKRPGFLEATGTLVARFADGSRCEVTCWAIGEAPVVVEIFDPAGRDVVRESEGRLWHSDAAGGWRWSEEEATIPFQSQMTVDVVRELLDGGRCALAPFDASARMHVALLEPLSRWAHAAGACGPGYPFT